MTTIGVRELRRDASRWLARVRAGEAFIVTNRGRPVARLAPLHEPTGYEALLAAARIAPGDGRPMVDVLAEIDADLPIDRGHLGLRCARSCVGTSGSGDLVPRHVGGRQVGAHRAGVGSLAPRAASAAPDRVRPPPHRASARRCSSGRPSAGPGRPVARWHGSPADRRRRVRCCGRTSPPRLRSLDSLHVASAMTLGPDLAGSWPTTIGCSMRRGRPRSRWHPGR